MAGKFRNWADKLPVQSKQQIWDGVREAGVNEARYARDDIRQKLIEEGWTGKAQTDKGRFYEAGASEPEIGPPEEVDIQGNRIEGEDFKGTVWDQENRNGIEPMNAPSMPEGPQPYDGREPE